MSITTAYPWIKSMHITSVVLWMGAQLLLPFLLTAHRNLPSPSTQATLLAQIERSLIRRVLNPAMLATFLFGALLASTVIDDSWHLPRWLALKLGLVFALSALHGKLLRQSWRATEGGGQWPAWGYRLAQGCNFMLLAGVVALAVTRPLP